jgi:hypothetical protein
MNEKKRKEKQKGDLFIKETQSPKHIQQDEQQQSFSPKRETEHHGLIGFFSNGQPKEQPGEGKGEQKERKSK